MCNNLEKMLRNESCIWEKKGRNLTSPYFSELPYSFFFFCQLFSLRKSTFCSISQNSHFWQISDCLVLFHSSQEERIHEQSIGEELKVHDKWMFLQYSTIYTVDITAIQMESFGIHVYIFKRITWWIFSSVGAELLLVQFFIIQAFLVKRRLIGKVYYKGRKRKLDIFKITEKLLFSFLEFGSLAMV